MRLGVLVPVGPRQGLGGNSAAAVAEVEEAGLDLALLRGDVDGVADALTAAAFLAGSTHTLRLIASVPLGVHPLHIAEQAAVADNALLGRLGVALEQGQDLPVLMETAEALLRATGPRPFRHRGSRWSIPGNVDGNVSERRISVTPNPAQLELSIWVSGAAAGRVAAELGLSYLSNEEEDGLEARRTWEAVERALGRASLRMRRPALRKLGCAANGDFDDDELAERLEAESQRWGLDVAILAPPATLDHAARKRAIARLASYVRPRLQMDTIPERVQAYWKREPPGLPGDD